MSIQPFFDLQTTFLIQFGKARLFLVSIHFKMALPNFEIQRQELIAVKRQVTPPSKLGSVKSIPCVSGTKYARCFNFSETNLHEIHYL